jgi:hypothetical protein
MANDEKTASGHELQQAQNSWLKPIIVTAVITTLVAAVMGILGYLAHDKITIIERNITEAKSQGATLATSLADFKKDSDNTHKELKNAILLASAASDKKTKAAIRLLLANYQSVVQKQQELGKGITDLQKTVDLSSVRTTGLIEETRVETAKLGDKIEQVGEQSDDAWKTLDVLLRPRIQESVKRTLDGIVSEWSAAQMDRVPDGRPSPGSGFTSGGTVVSTVPEITSVSIDHGKVTVGGVVPSEKAREAIRKAALAAGARDVGLNNLRIQP